MTMLKKLAICILVLFIPLIISAEELSESESFLAAKAAYDDLSYGDSLDLFNKFIASFPKSPAIPEAKLYIAQSFFQDNKFIEARETLDNLEKSYVPFAIEDKFLFLSGQVYSRAKDFKEAAKYFKKLIESHPDSVILVNAKMQLGWALFQDGQYQQAEKVFDLLAKSDDLNIQEEALFKKGEALFFAKDYVKALESYNAFFKIFPKSDKLARAYFYMAEANFYLEDLPSAVDYYSQVLKSARDDDPTKISALQGLGWSYLKQNKLSQAEENFLKVEKIKDVDFNKENFLFGMASLYYQLAKFDKAIIYYDELINRYPSSELFVQALFGKGQCLVNLSNYDQAIVLYDKVVEKCLESTNPQTKDLLDKSNYNLGYIYFSKEDFKNALPKFQETAYSTTDKELKRSAFTYLADINQEIQKFDKAIEIYSQILRDYPDSPYNDYVLYQLAVAHLKAGDLAAAISSFKDFNERFSASEYIDDVNYYLGYAYFKNNDFASASAQLEKFSKAFGDSAYLDKAIYLIANSFYNRKMFQEAVDNFENVLKNFPQNKVLAEKAEYSIIYALYEQDKDAEAIKRIRQFIESHPDSPLTKYLIFWLGQYYYDNSLYELSRNNFEKVITDYPQDKKFAEEAQYEIGLCYLAENKTEDALLVFNKLSKGTDNALLKIKATLAIADLLYQSDKTEEAIKMYNEVVNLVSKFKAAKEKDKTEVEFDSLLDYTGEETEPLESDIFTGAKDKDGDSAINILTAAYIRLGDLYKENKDFDNAIYAYRQAVKNTKEGSKVYLQFEIGECFEEKNDLDLAIEEYLKIPYLSEQDKFLVVKGLLRCANIYEDREDWQKAIAMYERMLNYDTPETKYAKERIESIKSETARH